ncbi:hypothetical protein CAEBREN_22995 [Caenorhabditis brenneri]|uniref:Leishmanolysin-like peptidase n=1 Tax=Caenorhabditis brenneri TaxID=135651 RepID=G0NWC8_CAEBE|nr:hypothetical protein CAEBREN_22995 [Caenorhabditis brenneri]
MIFLLLFNFLCYFSVNGTPHPMKIAVISGYGTLDSDMQTELQNSLKWFQSAFLVNKSSNPVTIKDVFQSIPEYQKFSSVLVQTHLHRQNIKLQDVQQLLEVADFTVFVIAQDPRRCARDPDLLAEAMPIVPPLATMSICLKNNPRHRNPSLDSRFFFDLFRHEILHGLGYGMIIDKSSLTHRPSEKYIWRNSNGIGHPEMRQFLDFDDFALKKAKSHFGCDKMKGIDADGERKNHLNEYIFGNELMTTHLEASGNIFSWISVGIIERTFNGKEQWYHINRTFVAPEANQYSYGRNFGCDFLQRSCHEFIKITEKLRPNMSIAPFCSKNNRNKCFKLPGSELVYKMSDKECEMRRVIGDESVSSCGGNEHKSHSLCFLMTQSTIYHLQTDKQQQRRCPIIKHLPVNYEVVQCPRAG